MNRSLIFTVVCLSASVALAQNGRGRQQQGRRKQQGQQQQQGRQGGNRLQAVDVNPLAVGDSGVAWYATWKTGVEEAKRSNRPIFFMSAAAQCSGVSGVF